MKVAKKADSKKVGAKAKVPRVAGNTKSRSARSKAAVSDKDPPVPKISEDTEAIIDRHGAEKSKLRGEPTTTATARKMTSRNVGTATKNSAPERRRTRSVAMREATVIAKKATRKNTKTTAKAQTAAAQSGATKATRSQKDTASARDDMLPLWPAELDENDIRKRLRPRKRT